MLSKLGESHQLWGPESEQTLNTELPSVDEALFGDETQR